MLAEGGGGAEEPPASASSPQNPPCRIGRVLYAFKPEEEGELELTPGDFVVINSDEAGWSEGENKTGAGRFPSNYVQEYTTSVFVALAPYEAASETELTLAEGDVIKLIEVDPSGWWKGSNQRNEEGWFPAAYVEPKEE